MKSVDIDVQQAPEGESTLGQRLVRWLWRKEYAATPGPRGLSAAQEKLVRWMSLSKQLHQQSPRRARSTYLLLDRFFGIDRVSLAQVSDHQIPVASGFIVVRCYQSSRSVHSKGAPGLVYFHGGGCVIGDLDTHDSFCRWVAKAAGITVLSVDYRLAPEHGFPTQITDAIEGWNWVCEHADDWGLDVTRLGVGGDSAGGYLAASVCQQAIQSEFQVEPTHKPAFQWLIYPWLDCRLVSESSNRCVADMLLTRDTMSYFIDHMLGQQNAHQSPVAESPLASPALAHNLEALPPTYLATAGFDPLNSEGKEYAERLRQAGVAVDEAEFTEMMHGFISLAGVCAHALSRSDQMIQGLSRLVKGQVG